MAKRSIWLKIVLPIVVLVAVSIGLGLYFWLRKQNDIFPPNDIHEGLSEQDKTTLENFEISEYSIDGIDGYAIDKIKNTTNLENVIIPETFKDKPIICINIGAFESSLIVNIKIPNSIIKLHNGCFNSCTELEKVNLDSNSSLEEINVGVFSGCLSLSEITLPETVLIIGDNAFDSCKSLTEFRLPKSVLELGWHVFLGCTSLGKLTLADGKIASLFTNEIFNQCGNLTTLVVESGIISPVDSSRFGDVSPDEIDYDLRKLGFFSKMPMLKTLILEDGVEEIGDFAFAWCTNLTTVSIADSVTRIGIAAFGLSSIGSVVLPANLSAVEKYTFEGCIMLNSVEIPGSVVSISHDIFYDYCGTVEFSEEINWNELKISRGMFDLISQNVTIIVNGENENQVRVALNKLKELSYSNKFIVKISSNLLDTFSQQNFGFSQLTSI